jgi:hypothetical protein
MQCEAEGRLMIAKRIALSAAFLSFAIGGGTAFAQNTAPAPSAVQPAVPAVQSAAPTTASPTDKKAVSKACSDQANAKGLHGKARKEFRSNCKKGGSSSQ